jgi:hypothetical protein
MAATKLSVTPKPTKQELAAAKSFVKLLRLTTKDPEYNFAVMWYVKEARRFKRRNDVLTKQQREVFDADTASGKFGRVHNAILNKIIGALESYEAPKKPQKPRTTRTNKKTGEPSEQDLDKILKEIQKGITPEDATQKVIKPQSKKKKTKKTEKPTLTLEASNELVKRGEKITLKWESTNADTVVAADFKATETNGILEISAPSRKTTYEIIVSGPGGTAEASVTILIEDEFDAAIKEVKASSPPSVDDGEGGVLVATKKKITDKLPKNLYRESVSRGNYDLFFEVDFDMACYVLASKPGRKNSNDPYLLWARQVSGQEPRVIYEHGKKVIKSALKRIKNSTPRK